MDSQVIVFLLIALLPLILTSLGYFVGTFIEIQHYKSIRTREQKVSHIAIIAAKHVTALEGVEAGQLISHSVVISNDAFKRFLAGLKKIFGGRISSYESLLDRARREALIRVKMQAIKEGAHVLANVRMETSNIGMNTKKQKTTCVEVLVYATALKLRTMHRNAFVSATP